MTCRAPFVLSLIGLGLLLAAPPPARGSGTGWGESYWGPIPPPADSVRVLPADPGLPVWEASLVYPYRLVTFPIKAFTSGVGAGVSFLDRQKAIYRVLALLGPRDLPFGFRLNMSAGGLPGFGGGVAFYHNSFLDEGNHLELRIQGTVRGNRRATLGLLMPERDGMGFEIGAGHRIDTHARYFGVGPGTLEENEAYYTLEQDWVGLSWTRRVTGPLAAETEVLYSAAGSRATPEDDEPPVREVFAGDLPPGFGRTSKGISLDLSLVRDTTPMESRPERGGIQRLKVSRFQGLGDFDAELWTYRAEVQQFIPLFLPQRVLAFRGFISWVDPAGAAGVPFERMATNDDPDLLRGYRDFRWRDRGMVVGTLEYRWPLWVSQDPRKTGLDSYLFTDLGQVFGNAEEISLDHLTGSYGFGVRMASGDRFLARFECAWSDEEFVLRFRADQVFQFAKGGLYHGRNPIPLR